MSEKIKKQDLFIIFISVLVIFLYHFTLLFFVLNTISSEISVLAIFEFLWFLWFFAGSLFARDIRFGTRASLLLSGFTLSLFILSRYSMFAINTEGISFIALFSLLFTALSPVFFAGSLMVFVRSIKIKYSHYVYGFAILMGFIIFTTLFPILSFDKFVSFIVIPILVVNAVIIIIIKKYFKGLVIFLIPSLVAVYFLLSFTPNIKITKTFHHKVLKISSKNTKNSVNKLPASTIQQNNFRKNDLIVKTLQNLHNSGIKYYYFILFIVLAGLLFYRKNRNTFDEIPAIYWLALLSSASAISAQIVISYNLSDFFTLQSFNYALIHSIFMLGMTLGFGKDFPFIKKSFRLFIVFCFYAITLLFIPFALNVSIYLLFVISFALGVLAGLSLYISLKYIKQFPQRFLSIVTVSFLGSSLGAFFLVILGYNAFGTTKLFVFLAVTIFLSALLRAIPLFLSKHRLIPPKAKTFPWIGVSIFLFVVFSNVLIFGKAAVSNKLENKTKISTESKYKTKPFPHKITYEKGEKYILVHSFHVNGAKFKGFASNIDVIVKFDEKGTIVSVDIGQNKETPSFIKKIKKKWIPKFKNFPSDEDFFGKNSISTVSGATLSTLAIKKSIGVVRKQVLEKIFKKNVKESKYKENKHIKETIFTVLFFVFSLFIAVFARFSKNIPLYLRLVLLFSVFWFFGIKQNTMLSLVDLGMFYQGIFPNYLPKLYLIFGIIIFSFLFGSLWCGFLCPFGALQEIIRTTFLILKDLITKRKITKAVFIAHRDSSKTQMSYLLLSYVKYVFLVLSLSIFAFTFKQSFLAWDPMAFIFSFKYSVFEWVFIVVFIALSIFYFRPYCRFFCPVGALLSIFNLFAPLRRFLPTRRFVDCDFGVKNKRDVTCIYCNRCSNSVKKK